MSQALLLTGGPGHDFAGTGAALTGLVEEQGLVPTVVDDPDDAVAALRDEGDAVSLFVVSALRWRMDAARYADQREELAFSLAAEAGRVIDRYVRGGGGLLALHTAVICFDAEPHWRALLGAAWDWSASSHPPLGRVAVRVTEVGRAHPVTAGTEGFVVVDEAYGFLDEDADLEPLLISGHGGRDHPLLWVREHGRGRVVTDLLGHDACSLEHAAHRAILARAVAWAARRAPDDRPRELGRRRG